MSNQESRVEGRGSRVSALLVALLLCLWAGVTHAQVVGGGPPVFGSAGTDSNTVYTIALTAANAVGGATNGVTAVTATNAAISVVSNSPTMWSPTLLGITSITNLNVDTLYATNLVGDLDGNAATATVANRLSQHIAAFYVTNYTENRDSIYVTGNAAAAVNGRYKVSWYDPDNFVGIWTNTASTNMILMNNPSNAAAISGQPFIIAATNQPTEFMSQQNQDLIQIRDAWVNDFWADGMVDFTGTATLAWGSNAVRELVVTSFSVGGTNAGIVATNLIRVSALSGNDEIATRLNGYPFKTLYVAQTNATTYDLIYIEPGYHKTQPFHMANRGFHILGAGPDVCTVEVENLQSGVNTFQSRALIPWDNCSIGGFTITNGLIAFAQFSGVAVGGTNVWAHDLVVYPPRAIKFPDWTNLNPDNGDQQQYYNVGVDVSRIGSDNRIERVKVYSGMRGFNIQTTYSTSGTINLVDCEAYCAPDYSGSPNIWTNSAFMYPGSTNVGGMIPIAFSAKSPATQAVYPITVNIVGGKFVSLNGGTNVQAYVGGETQASRNASLWISRAYTNTVTINLSGVPRFYNGNTNSTSFAVLNEATNNNVTIAGYYTSNRVEQATNTLHHAAYGSGSVATSSSSMATMNFGATDPAFTVTDTGFYLVQAAAAGITVSADSSESISFQISSNSITIPSAFYSIPSVDSGLGGMQMSFSTAIPPVFTWLRAGDVVALQWQSTGGGTSWQGQSASVIALKVK